MRSESWRYALRFWRELREVVDAEPLLQRLDLLGDLLEAVGSELLGLALLERFADLLELVGRHQAAQGREHFGVLARGMRPVHGDGGLHGGHHLLALRLACALGRK